MVVGHIHTLHEILEFTAKKAKALVVYGSGSVMRCIAEQHIPVREGSNVLH